MFEWNDIAIYVAAAIVICVTPGPSSLYVVATSLEKGIKAGIISAVAVGLGGLLYAAMAVIGVCALLATSPVAFNIVKYCGAAYLIYLGFSTLFEKQTDPALKIQRESNFRRIFQRALMVQVFNPTQALFFLSFLPQFVKPGGVHPAVKTAILGLIFVLVAFVTDFLYALTAGAVGKGLAKFARTSSLVKWISGLTYLALGLLAAINR